MKKVFTVLLSLVILVVGVIASKPLYSLFSDYDQSSYKDEVFRVYSKILIDTPLTQTLKLSSEISREEVSMLMVNAFKLSKIQPMMIKTDKKKTFSYTDPLGVIDESFSIPSAQDIVESYYLAYIEGLIKIRAVQVSGERFNPTEPLSHVDFFEMLGKIIFGVDEKHDYLKEIAGMGFTAEEVSSKTNVTWEKALSYLDRILSKSDFKVISVLTTADIHGNLQQYIPSGSTYNIGGLSRMSKTVSDIRASQNNLLLLDVGDAPYNTNVANMFEGRPVISIMNLMKYDAMAIGNHDFDFPFDNMRNNSKIASFPFLSANTLYEGKNPDFLKPYVIKDVDGVKIGIIGLTDHDSAWYTHPNNVKGISFINHFQAAEKYVNELKGKVDIIISLAHLHGDNSVLPQKVTGIDFELAGGQDIVAYPQKINDTWVITSGKHSELVSRLNINMIGNKIIGFNFAHIFLTENLPQDPHINNIIAMYSDNLNKSMSQVVGLTQVDLDGERGTVRLKESNLGNLIADSLRDFGGADIALQNGGGIRASIKKGQITLKDIYTVLPFDNAVVVFKASGKVIWDTIEHSISQYPSAAGQFLQVSGMTYKFDASKEPYKRLLEIKINNEPIDLEKIYTVVANDFMTGGGDKYTMLRDNTQITIKTREYLRDVLKLYLMKVREVAPILEGRIEIVK
ncbi:MAG TPA: bifunctional UDP-sugar hydrolase/5'-nucleotidase [Petrotogaceae bacterium]|mgnify:FL=1|nr:bifunctional UDP-sugar hydrolase/5'-nucleotidase [Petrotogaceae bacterium]